MLHLPLSVEEVTPVRFRLVQKWDMNWLVMWSGSVAPVFVIFALPRASFAWNYTGHRVIASIAYRQLNDQTKYKIAEVLRKHPAHADL
jgi:hypothetical protein